MDGEGDSFDRRERYREIYREIKRVRLRGGVGRGEGGRRREDEQMG